MMTGYKFQKETMTAGLFILYATYPSYISICGNPFFCCCLPVTQACLSVIDYNVQKPQLYSFEAGGADGGESGREKVVPYCFKFGNLLLVILTGLQPRQQHPCLSWLLGAQCPSSGQQQTDAGGD